MKECISDAITAIFTVWRRNHLEEQLQALFQQTVLPSHIWVQQSQHHVDVSAVVDKYKDRVRYFCWENNPGVFGRFESVTQVETPYVYILDDDIIPGKMFIENALSACKRLNAIVCPHGRLLSPDICRTRIFVGDGYQFQHSFCLEDTEVDFGNNAWFFRREWIGYFLSEKPLYRNNGEDIHLSAMCKLLGNIPTYVPRQIVPVESGNVKRCYSADEHALHRKPLFSKERFEVVERFRNIGWHLRLEKYGTEQREDCSYAISVVMAVIGKDAGMAIQSILQQTWEDFELINVCTDKSAMPVNEDDERVHWIETKEELSKYVLWNIGCGVAKGKYICMMESGYVSSPDRLQSQYEFMEEEQEVIAMGATLDDKNLFLPSVIIRRDVLHRVKYYDESIGDLAENDLLCRLLQEGSVVLFKNMFVSKTE
ncbi:glycosyltransferase family 2 protein [Parabacteroides johnsonii]|uniref:glycosyltransferase family 2 protein n=1 Tax=Parabacteroides johnsonii TaxID=387661 RepID=UPI00242A3EAC|nr:glycosyltransferase family 2 protein [Parabacteroides johnsonii]